MTSDPGPTSTATVCILDQSAYHGASPLSVVHDLRRTSAMGYQPGDKVDPLVSLGHDGVNRAPPGCTPTFTLLAFDVDTKTTYRLLPGR